ncbi:uncharacterized protein LOC119162364 isoform X2 [Rhipicephalus microplus]|uniref:uncharacterized protein LOC119162364 isoform X2 n=1 Tax=Rhipicephalus microplus TaxID=6941 RepID=UPI003F6AAF44
MAVKESPGSSNTTDPVQPPPSTLAIHSHLCDPPVFSGLKGADVEEWLLTHDLVSQLNRAPCEHGKKCAHQDAFGASLQDYAPLMFEHMKSIVKKDVMA